LDNVSNFSKFAWDLYKKSPEGKMALEQSLEQFASQLLGEPEDEVFTCFFPEVDTNVTPHGGTELDAVGFFGGNVIPSWVGEDASSEDLRDAFDGLVDDGFYFTFKNSDPNEKVNAKFSFYHDPSPDFPFVYTGIYWISASFHIACPEFFAPFFFGRNFDLFANICRQFGIVLPELPGKLKKRERALYYLEINEALQTFRKANGLSPQEFNAFLYDFAIKDHEQRAPKQTKLPAPSRVWFVIGGTLSSNDREYVDRAEKDSVGLWQGNIDTRPGDIVVMYMASPTKAIHSIWRAETFGFIDPFFHFYSAMRLGKPVKIPELKFSEIASHPTFKDTPAIRARFQGRSGKELRIEEYDAILSMAKKKGFDISILPSPPEPIKLPKVETLNERDVETELLEPLLERLGFEDADWERQFSMKVGRSERVIPDYALLPEKSRNGVSARAMIEAKFNVVSEKERNEAFDQALSYAKLLGVSRMGVVARQGLWIYSTVGRVYDRNRGEAFTWADLEDPQRFARLLDLIGKDALLRIHC
jgi:hypothetical protein